MSAQSLRQELRAIVANLEAQMAVVRAKADQMGIPAISMMSANGNYILAPLLAAKAHALAGLAHLEKK